MSGSSPDADLLSVVALFFLTCAQNTGAPNKINTNVLFTVKTPGFMGS